MNKKMIVGMLALATVSQTTLMAPNANAFVAVATANPLAAVFGAGMLVAGVVTASTVPSVASNPVEAANYNATRTAGAIIAVIGFMVLPSEEGGRVQLTALSNEEESNLGFTSDEARDYTAQNRTKLNLIFDQLTADMREAQDFTQDFARPRLSALYDQAGISQPTRTAVAKIFAAAPSARN